MTIEAKLLRFSWPPTVSGCYCSWLRIPHGDGGFEWEKMGKSSINSQSDWTARTGWSLPLVWLGWVPMVKSPSWPVKSHFDIWIMHITHIKSRKTANYHHSSSPNEFCPKFRLPSTMAFPLRLTIGSGLGKVLTTHLAMDWRSGLASPGEKWNKHGKKW